MTSPYIHMDNYQSGSEPCAPLHLTWAAKKWKPHLRPKWASVSYSNQNPQEDLNNKIEFSVIGNYLATNQLICFVWYLWSFELFWRRLGLANFLQFLGNYEPYSLLQPTLAWMNQDWNAIHCVHLNYNIIKHVSGFPLVGFTMMLRDR